jgi:Ran GTPase-activating protein (RanGAP) involved in mRNA processing and transport
MGNVTVAEELAGSDELDELYRLDASESEPEAEPDDDDDENQDDENQDDEDENEEGIKPGGMPHG